MRKFGEMSEIDIRVHRNLMRVYVLLFAELVLKVSIQ